MGLDNIKQVSIERKDERNKDRLLGHFQMKRSGKEESPETEKVYQNSKRKTKRVQCPGRQVNKINQGGKNLTV